MHKVIGRSDDMLKIRGVNVFPSQIESALVGIRQIGPHYQLVVTPRGLCRHAGGAGGTGRRLAAGRATASWRHCRRGIHDKIKAILGIDD